MSIETAVLMNGYSVPALFALPILGLSPKHFPNYVESYFVTIQELGEKPLLLVEAKKIDAPDEVQLRQLTDLPNIPGFMSNFPDEQNPDIIRWIFRPIAVNEVLYTMVLEGNFHGLEENADYKTAVYASFPEMADKIWQLVEQLSGKDNRRKPNA